jgi:hypothetical protein
MIPKTARAERAETVEKAEGKIKADGTIPGHRAQISRSAHWLGDGARHRPEGGAVPRLGETPAFAGFLTAPRLDFGIFRPVGTSGVDEQG